MQSAISGSIGQLQATQSMQACIGSMLARKTTLRACLNTMQGRPSPTQARQVAVQACTMVVQACIAAMQLVWLLCRLT